MKKQLLEFILLVACFFALYALTAQRGFGWGDSAEFQDWALNHAEFVCGPQYSNAHPLYVALCRFVASGPFGVTLVSSFFGALAVGGLYLCAGRMSLSVLFGLSQMAWWLSCVAEVQMMSLAMTAFETWLMLVGLRRVKKRSAIGVACLCAASFLSGLHLAAHNFALLCLPVYAIVAAHALLSDRERSRTAALLLLSAIGLCWAAGASVWLYHIVVRGLLDVLFGVYGGRVFGLLPRSWTRFAFNFALASLSFAVPAFLAWRARKQGMMHPKAWIIALFAVNFLFWIRYFVPDQSQFLLPTLFFAYLMIADVQVKGVLLASLAAVQIALPVLFFGVASRLPTPAERRGLHDGRDDARYFILPWRTPAWP